MDFNDILDGLHKPTSLIFEASATLNSDKSNTCQAHTEFKGTVNDIKSSLQNVWQQVSSSVPIGLIDYKNPNADQLNELDLDPMKVITEAFKASGVNITILEEAANFLTEEGNQWLINLGDDEINAAAQSARNLQEQLAM